MPPGRRSNACRISRAVHLLAFASGAAAVSCTALPPPQEWMRRERLPPPALLALPPRPAVVRELGWEEALRIALERNPTLEAARRRIERSQALLEEAEALAWPVLSARASYLRFLEAAQFRGRTGTEVADISTRARFFAGAGSEIYSGGFDLRYALFDGGQAYYARRSAAAEVGAERGEEERVLAALQLAVSEAFLGALLARGAVQIAEEALAFSEGEEARERARVEAGEGLRVDQLRFATRASESRLELNRARAAYRLRLAALSELLGAPVAPEVRLLEPEAELEVPEDEPLEVVLERRPEVLAQSARIEAAEARYAQEGARYFPVLSLFGSYGFISLDALELSGETDELQVGAALAWSLFEGGATTARRRAARREIDELAAGLQEIRLRVERELQEARTELEVARENTRVSEETARLAQELLERTTARRRAGEAQVLDVTQAELQLTAARLALNRSRVEVLLAQARLRKALGWKEPR
jgi:outer membrane protein TolC